MAVGGDTIMLSIRRLSLITSFATLLLLQGFPAFAAGERGSGQRLSDLLGVQQQSISDSRVSITRHEPPKVSRPVDDPTDDFNLLNNGCDASPRFPVIRRIVRVKIIQQLIDTGHYFSAIWLLRHPAS